MGGARRFGDLGLGGRTQQGWRTAAGALHRPSRHSALRPQHLSSVPLPSSPPRDLEGQVAKENTYVHTVLMLVLSSRPCG